MIQNPEITNFRTSKWKKIVRDIADELRQKHQAVFRNVPLNTKWDHEVAMGIMRFASHNKPPPETRTQTPGPLPTPTPAPFQTPTPDPVTSPIFTTSVSPHGQAIPESRLLIKFSKGTLESAQKFECTVEGLAEVADELRAFAESGKEDVSNAKLTSTTGASHGFHFFWQHGQCLWKHMYPNDPHIALYGSVRAEFSQNVQWVGRKPIKLLGEEPPQIVLHVNKELGRSWNSICLYRVRANGKIRSTTYDIVITVDALTHHGWAALSAAVLRILDSVSDREQPIGVQIIPGITGLACIC